MPRWSSEDGRFLVDHMVEVPSCVLQGPAAAISAIDEAMELVLAVTGTPAARCARSGSTRLARPVPMA